MFNFKMEEYTGEYINNVLVLHMCPRGRTPFLGFYFAQHGLEYWAKYNPEKGVLFPLANYWSVTLFRVLLLHHSLENTDLFNLVLGTGFLLS